MSAFRAALWSLLLLLRLPALLAAQAPEEDPRTGGVEAPDDGTPSEAYRLPDWCYSTLTVEASGDADGDTRTREGANSTFTDERASANLRLASSYRAF